MKLCNSGSTRQNKNKNKKTNNSQLSSFMKTEDCKGWHISTTKHKPSQSGPYIHIYPYVYLYIINEIKRYLCQVEQIGDDSFVSLCIHRLHWDYGRDE
jgi:hypothetical protein